MKVVDIKTKKSIECPIEFAEEIVLLIKDLKEKKVERITTILAIDDGQIAVFSSAPNNAYALFDIECSKDVIIRHDGIQSFIRES